MTLSAALQENLRNEISRLKGSPFAVFDFDNTCIHHDIGEATLAHICRHGLLKDHALLGTADEGADYHERVFRRYHELLAQDSVLAAYELAAKVFSGFTPAEAEEATRDAIASEGTTIGKTELFGQTIAHGLTPNDASLALLAYVKELGAETWIVSASVEPAVKAAMAHFGIEAKLVGVRAKLEDGRYTNELLQPMSILEGKVACYKKYISESQPPLLAVDDSITGISLMETAVVKVVVDRGNALAKTARERGWFLI